MINRDNLKIANDYKKYLDEKFKKEDDLLYDLYVMNNMNAMDENIRVILGTNTSEEAKREMLDREFTIFGSYFNIQ